MDEKEIRREADKLLKAVEQFTSDITDIAKYSGKHRKPSIWSRIWPKRPNLYQRLEKLPKAVVWHETDKYVQFMPRWTEEYILPDYCAN